MHLDIKIFAEHKTNFWYHSTSVQFINHKLVLICFLIVPLFNGLRITEKFKSMIPKEFTVNADILQLNVIHRCAASANGCIVTEHDTKTFMPSFTLKEINTLCSR